jgi:hypothetical protein
MISAGARCGFADGHAPSCGIRYGLTWFGSGHWTVSRRRSCIASTSIVVAARADASTVAVDAASNRGSTSLAPIVAGAITKAPKVIAVMAAAPIPIAACRTHV